MVLSRAEVLWPKPVTYRELEHALEIRTATGSRFSKNLDLEIGSSSILTGLVYHCVTDLEQLRIESEGRFLKS